MTSHRAVLGLVLIAMVLGIAAEARAQYPMPRVRERPEAIEAAFRFFEEGRWPVIGEEDRRLEAVRGESYARLKEVADRVLEFARTVPRLPDFEAKAAPTPPKPGKKRR